MPQNRLVADVFGVVTVSLVFLFALAGLLFIYRSIHLQLRIRRGGFLQLSYFSGPWITRVVLVLVAIWSGVGEIARLSVLRGEERLLSSSVWQKYVCKIYILSNLGFAEPCLLLMLAFLIRASLQKKESGTLSRRWNRRTIGYIIVMCVPIFILHVALLVLGLKLSEGKSNKISKYFSTSSPIGSSDCICTYPLSGIIVLGFFYALLIGFVVCIGAKMLSLVINKGLRRRVYWLMNSVVFFLPSRALLLGFSVLPYPGNFAHELIVFLAFTMLFCCTMITSCVLVYCPVADTLALKNMSLNCSEGGYLVPQRSDGLDESGRNSDASTKRSSVSFRNMIRDEAPMSDYQEDAIAITSFATLLAASPSMSPVRPLGV